MSEFTAVMFILATYGLLILCTTFLYIQALRRKDQIVTGIVDGVPVSMKHRWIMLFFEFIGYGNIVVILHGVFAIGYFRAASIVSDSVVGGVAFLCGAAAVFGAGATFFPAVVLAFYLVSVLRQAEAD
jgi:hypothetical protein